MLDKTPRARVETLLARFDQALDGNIRPVRVDLQFTLFFPSLQQRPVFKELLAKSISGRKSFKAAAGASEGFCGLC